MALNVMVGLPPPIACRLVDRFENALRIMLRLPDLFAPAQPAR
jgi:hypothetical protein